RLERAGALVGRRPLGGELGAELRALRREELRGAPTLALRLVQEVADADDQIGTCANRRRLMDPSSLLVDPHHCEERQSERRDQQARHALGPDAGITPNAHVNPPPSLTDPSVRFRWI